MLKVDRIRMANPHQRRGQKKRRPGAKRASRAGGHHRARKNPTELLSLGFTNPYSRRTAMASHKHKKGKKGHRRGGRRSNPHKMHRRRHNPGMLTGATSILKDGFYALLGLVVARQLPQMVLGARNTGAVGYLANFVTTIIAAMVGAKALGREAGKMIGVGGGIYTVNRVIQDQLSPVSKVLSLSGIGDYSALGDIQPGYFPLPVPTDAAGRPIIPVELRPPAPAAAAAATGGGGMSGVARGTRFVSRF